MVLYRPDQSNWSSAIRIYYGVLTLRGRGSAKGLSGRPSKPFTRYVPGIVRILAETNGTYVQALAGKPYPYVQYGKPTAATYKFAESVLKDRLAEIQGSSVSAMPQVYVLSFATALLHS